MIAALEQASVIVVAPSNPLVSIGPIRALAGVDELLAGRREQVVAVSPIVAGAALKGPADRMLVELGHEPTVVGVARLYAPVCGTLVIDRADAGLAGEVEADRDPLRRHRHGDAHPRDRPLAGVDDRGGMPMSRITAGEWRGSARSARRSARRADRRGLRTRPMDRSSLRRRARRHPEDRLQGRRAVRRDRSHRPALAQAIVEDESVRMSCRRRADLVITETRHGFVCAQRRGRSLERRRGIRRVVAPRCRPLRPSGARTSSAPASG